MIVSFSAMAQKSGLAYRNIAIALDKEERFDSAAFYYDSAFHQYVKQRHFASATLAYFPLEKYLIDEGQKDSTHYYMRSLYDSSKYLTRYNDSDGLIALKKNLADYYFEKHLFDSAQAVLDLTVGLSVKKYGAGSIQNSELFAMQSLTSFYEGNLDLATSLIKQAMGATSNGQEQSEYWINYLEYNHLLENRQAVNDLSSSQMNFPEKEVVVKIYHTLDTYNTGHLEDSFTEFQKIVFDQDSTTSKAVILKYNYLKSLLLLEKGEFDESLTVAKQFLPLAQRLYPESHPLSADYYQQICRIYYEKSDFGAAREFIQRLISGMEKNLGDGHPLKSNAYFEYSRLLSALENYNQSNVSIDSAIVISGLQSKPPGIFLGRCYNQKGVVSYFLDQLDSAEQHLMRSWQILDDNLDNKQHIYLARVFNDLGRVYQQLEIDDNAIRDYVKSLKIYRTLLGKVHPHLGTGYYNVGTLYAKNGLYKQALESYQTSLISNIFDFQDTSILVNPSIDNVMSDFILLKSLTGKVEALELYYDQQSRGEMKLLEAALDTYVLIADLIDKLRTGYVSAESKQFLAEKTSYLYEKAIQLCLRVSRITGESNYLETAFFFSEKSRAGILLSGIQDANAKKIAGVPDSLLVREKGLVQLIADKEVELFEELNKGTRARPSVVANFQDELFNLKNEYSDFIYFLENEYNSYYQLKHDNYSASVQDIQSSLFNPINKKDKKRYALLEYFIGQDSIYIFQVDKESFQLIVNEKPVDFERIIRGLRNSILYDQNEAFIELSTGLYQLLIPIEITKKMHVTIIPDGILSYLPFESLLYTYSEKPLRKQKFLIRNTSISYSYSATLSVEMTRNPFDYDSGNNSFAGFAPVFSTNQQFQVMSSNKPGSVELTMGDTLSGQPYEMLAGSELELEGIFKVLNRRRFESNAYFFNSASKQNLLESSTLNSRFMHFATHGILDEDQPNFSGIVLSDSTENEILTLGEIYGFNTQAEVVALSACETGLGQLLRGEGLIGLSRGFFFAGSKFIIVSLWKVEDESTAKMATRFYKKYAKKKRKDIYGTFQKARISVIKKKKFDKLSDWFPFVLVGMH